MIPETALKKISDIVGVDHLINSVENLAEYGTDATKLEFIPDAVAFPGKSEEISRILSLATETGFPVVPRGAGSGMSGGALPVKGGLVIAMNRLNRILNRILFIKCRHQNRNCIFLISFRVLKQIFPISKI